MSELPTGWAEASIKDVAELRSGFGFPTSLQGRSEGDLGFYKVGDISRNWQNGQTYLSAAEHYISHEEAKRLRAVPFPAGSVVFAKIGAAVALNRRAILKSASLVDNNVMGLAPYECTTPEFLFHFMCRVDLGVKTRGGNVPSLRKSDVEEIPFPLPPLPEQKRIVAKIEELFSELEAGEASLRKARRQLAVYRQSLLKQAFEGKLTAQWRTQNPDKLESPASLLARIQSARQARYEEELKEWARKLKQWEKSSQTEKRPTKPRRPQDVQLPAEDQIGNLPELPAAWAWISVANCAVEISDGPFGSNLKSDDYVSAGVRVVRLENIGAGEFIEDKESFISPEKYQKLKRHTVRPGDIVVASFINDAVRAALVPPSIEYAVNKADCFQVHCFGDTISSDFLVRCFGARYFFKQLEQLVHGVGRPRINTTQLGEAFVPLCPLPEQQEIVRLLDEQFEAIDRNERELDAALQRSEALQQSILKKAFTGRLVPQDPSDEPASTLLARLRAERTTQSVKTKSRT